MSLLDVRKQFIATSGRLNLVVDTVDYIDDGANYYIQNGQKWLERQIEFLPQKGKVFRKLESGKYA